MLNNFYLLDVNCDNSQKLFFLYLWSDLAVLSEKPKCGIRCYTYLLNNTMSGFQTLCGRIRIVVIPPYSEGSQAN